ncbi:MAG: phosphate acetyltransferase [Hyphomicrobiales bacterium]|nr:phosphate acetyltransferase [Hyphomicrobiales bacterium]
MTRTEMPRFLFVAPASSGIDVSVAALGVAGALQEAGHRVGFVKPIGDPDVAADRPDGSRVFARTLFGFSTPEPIPLSRAEEMLRRGRLGTLLEEVVALVEEAGRATDVVVVQGASLAPGHVLVADLDAAVARNLAAEVIAVVGGRSGNVASIRDAVADATHRFAGDRSLGGVVVVNVADGFRAALAAAEMPAPVLGLVPEDPNLAAPRLSDVVGELGFTVVHPGGLAQARVRDVVVAARSPEHLVARLGPGTLVVTPGDRLDVVTTTVLAAASGMPIAGLLMTCGATPSPEIAAFLAARWGDLAVLETEWQTFEAAARLAEFDRSVRADDQGRMERSIAHVSETLDVAALALEPKGAEQRPMSPPIFRHELICAAQAADRRIVLPEGDEPRTLAAAADCQRRRIARCVLLGRPDEVRAAAALHGVDLPAEIEILDPAEIRERYVAPMIELRKSKGLAADQARAQLEDNVVLGTMMLAIGDVDGLVSGAVHTTASTVRPALQLIKTRPGNTLVSSVFFMLMPDQVLVYGDCAVNPHPTAEELAEIAIQSADSAAAFGIEPRVAMISYSTGASGAGVDVEKVRAATEIVRRLRPHLAVDGPIQYDAASVESVGRQKAPNSPVAGHANVFVFPDLNTGNTTYKAVQRSANVVSIGPMLQGLRKPVNDLSRGALVDDIVYTIALTAIQAATDAAVEAEPQA